MTLSADEVTLCNQALDGIGAAIFAYATQTTNEALKCNRHYSQTRDYLLEELEPVFSRGRAELTIYGIGSLVYWEGSPVTYESASVYYGVTYYEDDFEWDYIYDLPSDFLALRSEDPIYELDGQVYEPSDRYDVAGDLFYTNLDEVHLRYIKSVTDPDDFDSSFKQILILALELKLLNPLAGTENARLREGIEEKLRYLIARAKSKYKKQPDTTGYSTWNNSRYGSGKV
jgi:hypothetical protein